MALTLRLLPDSSSALSPGGADLIAEATDVHLVGKLWLVGDGSPGPAVTLGTPDGTPVGEPETGLGARGGAEAAARRYLSVSPCEAGPIGEGTPGVHSREGMGHWACPGRQVAVHLEFSGEWSAHLHQNELRGQGCSMYSYQARQGCDCSSSVLRSQSPWDRIHDVITVTVQSKLRCDRNCGAIAFTKEQHKYCQRYMY